MTIIACCRPRGIAGLFFSPVALDAHLVHDLLWFKLSLGFCGFNRTRGLGENMVTDVAIAKVGLVLVVGKGHATSGTATEFDLIGAFIDNGSG